MLRSGFNGTVYNGRGVNRWTAAGFPLVNTPSVLPKCSTKQGPNQAAEPCQLEEETTSVPTTAPVGTTPEPVDECVGNLNGVCTDDKPCCPGLFCTEPFGNGVRYCDDARRLRRRLRGTTEEH